MFLGVVLAGGGGGGGAEGGKGIRQAREGGPVGEERDCGAANVRVGLKTSGFSLYLVVSRLLS